MSSQQNPLIFKAYISQQKFTKRHHIHTYKIHVYYINKLKIIFFKIKIWVVTDCVYEALALVHDWLELVSMMYWTIDMFGTENIHIEQATKLTN